MPGFPEEIEKRIELAKSQVAGNDADAAIKLLIEALTFLTGPQEKQNDGHFIVKYIVQVCLRFGRLDEAKTWALKLYDYGTQQNEAGEKDYLHGRVEFARKNLTSAKELFQLAYKKSEGRYPPEKEKEYLKLIKS